MEEEKKLDDIKELNNEELDTVSGGGIIRTYPRCSHCNDGFIMPSGRLGSADFTYRCNSCGAEI